MIMRKIFLIILLSLMTVSLEGQNMALTRTKPVRMVSVEAGYSLFVKAYVENEMEYWQRKDPNESYTRYKNRTTEEHRKEMMVFFEEEAKEKYLQEMSEILTLNFSVKGYDRKEETMLMEESQFGKIEFKVPESESDKFMASWWEMEYTPDYFIYNDTLALAKVLFYNDEGNVYTYINKLITDSIYIGLPYSLSPVLIWGDKSKNNIVEDENLNDIEVDIPRGDSLNDKTWVVIMANEHYRYEPKMMYSNNDAELFKKYCINTFRIPKNNIRYIRNATLRDFESAVAWLLNATKQCGGDAKVLFYYSGHGMLSLKNNKSYFVPVDGSFDKVKSCYGMDLFLSNLSAMPVSSAVVFVDAGFSSYDRNGKKSDAKVSIGSNSNLVKGNVVLCMAAQDNESIFLFQDKSHSLFTYFLLSEIRKDYRNIKLGDLFYNVQNKVKTYSLSKYKTMQMPVLIYSANLKDSWKDIEL